MAASTTDLLIVIAALYSSLTAVVEATVYDKEHKDEIKQATKGLVEDLYKGLNRGEIELLFSTINAIDKMYAAQAKENANV